MTELEEYIKECDCEKIDSICCKLFKCEQTLVVTDTSHLSKVVWLPTIDQLLEMLGDRFKIMEHKHYTDGRWVVWADGLTYGNLFGQSARIALVRAVKETENE